MVKAKACAKPKPEPKAVEAAASTAYHPRRTGSIAQEELAARCRGAGECHRGKCRPAFVALIQQTVINYWSRPPSARNGMEAELAIQLIPTGEVVSVTIVRSSGNSAFDRSAVNAVEKAGAFPELQKLPGGEFEKTFRRFRLLFKPEDLRY